MRRRKQLGFGQTSRLEKNQTQIRTTSNPLLHPISRFESSTKAKSLEKKRSFKRSPSESKMPPPIASPPSSSPLTNKYHTLLSHSRNILTTSPSTFLAENSRKMNSSKWRIDCSLYKKAIKSKKNFQTKLNAKWLTKVDPFLIHALRIDRLFDVLPQMISSERDISFKALLDTKGKTMNSPLLSNSFFTN